MRLALRELRRQPGRFAIATLTLIAVLLMFLGGLLDGDALSADQMQRRRVHITEFFAAALKP